MVESGGHEDSAPWLSLHDAAATLKVSERTLRRWIASAGDEYAVVRTGYPALQLERRGSSRRVRLLDNPPPGPALAPVDADRQEAQGRLSARAGGAGEHVAPAAGAGEMPHEAPSVALVRERDAVALERDWLRAEIERRGVELAEMRRLLGNAQQQLAGLLAGSSQSAAALSADAAEPEQSGRVPHAQPGLMAMTAAVKQAAKQAGLGKKQRRRLVERLEQHLPGS